MRPRAAKKKKYPWDDPALSPAQRGAALAARRERLRRSLLGRIEAWARTFEDCPVAGCRRNERCLHRARCRVPRVSMSPEEEQALWREFRRQLRESLGEPAPPAPDVELSPQVRAWMAGEQASD